MRSLQDRPGHTTRTRHEDSRQSPAPTRQGPVTKTLGQTPALTRQEPVTKTLGRTSAPTRQKTVTNTANRLRLQERLQDGVCRGVLVTSSCRVGSRVCRGVLVTGVCWIEECGSWCELFVPYWMECRIAESLWRVLVSRRTEGWIAESVAEPCGCALESCEMCVARLPTDPNQTVDCRARHQDSRSDCGICRGWSVGQQNVDDRIVESDVGFW